MRERWAGTPLGGAPHSDRTFIVRRLFDELVAVFGGEGLLSGLGQHNSERHTRDRKTADNGDQPKDLVQLIAK